MKRQANGKFASKAGEVVRTETREFRSLRMDKTETFVGSRRVNSMEMELCFGNIEMRETGVINRNALITQHFMEDILAVFEKHSSIQIPVIKEIVSLEAQAKEKKDELYK